MTDIEMLLTIAIITIAVNALFWHTEEKNIIVKLSLLLWTYITLIYSLAFLNMRFYMSHDVAQFIIRKIPRLFGIIIKILLISSEIAIYKIKPLKSGMHKFVYWFFAAPATLISMILLFVFGF